VVIGRRVKTNIINYITRNFDANKCLHAGTCWTGSFKQYWKLSQDMSSITQRKNIPVKIAIFLNRSNEIILSRVM
jgi:hypothetical protein